jgi:steroid 5-alpha reductase family enzyme
MADLMLIDNLLFSFVVCLIIQALFFTIAVYYQTDKVTDLSYGLTFIVLSLLLLWINSTYFSGQVILSLMIVVWGIRLAAYLFIRINKMGRDKRFDEIRGSVLKFASFWFFQGITVFIIMLPAITMLSSMEKRPVFWPGFLIWLAGLIIETAADQQKFEFKNNLKNKGKWVDTGLWQYSRHPNYFGEMLCWWGIFIFSLPYLPGWKLLTIIGPIFITYILLFVSGIPPLEKRYEKKYGDNKAYKKYKAKTNMLIPLQLKN